MRFIRSRTFRIITLFVVISTIVGCYIEKRHNCGFVIETATDEEMAEYNSSDGRITDGKININSAFKEEIMTLDGIGETLAQRIIDYRENNDGFKTIEDIMKVDGIGKGLFEKIKENICAE